MQVAHWGGGRMKLRDWFAGAAALLALAMLSHPAKALLISTSPFQVTLTISLQPAPPPIIPGNPIDILLTGTAQFFTLTGHVDPFPVGDAIDIGSIGWGQSFTDTFVPAPPPIDIAFKFSGMLGSFDAGAYADTSSIPQPPPIFPVGSFTGAPIEFSGPIVAFDDPVVVGTWDIILTPVPEPASLAIFGAGLAMLGVIRRKRKAS